MISRSTGTGKRGTKQTGKKETEKRVGKNRDINREEMKKAPGKNRDINREEKGPGNKERKNAPGEKAMKKGRKKGL